LYLNSKIITGLAFIILGGLSYIARSGYINLGTEEIIGLTFIFYGIPSVYISLNDGKRSSLFSSTIIFFVGIIFIVTTRFELIDTRGLVFASILLIGGTAFLILFIENTKERIFLVAAIVLVALGYASTNIFKQLGILNTANKIANVVDNYWSIILIVLGLNIFLKRKK
jgi:hypothetical protein